MGIRQPKYEEFVSQELEEMKRLIKEKGIVGAQQLMRNECERQRDIKIGVAGMSGVGKSSFINAIRGYGS